MSSFSDYPLRASSLKALEAMQIETPTPIQASAIPPLLEGRDVIGEAWTGSGKTLAFGLPLVERVRSDVKRVQALVLAPTRELAQQVGRVLKQLVSGTGVECAIVFGGRAIGPQQEAIKRGAQIVVGTPGRILDLLSRRSMRLDHVCYLVLDEADEMLDQGFAPDVERILRAATGERQTGLFSATTPEWVLKVSAKHLNDPVVIQVPTDGADEPDIDHVVIEVWNGDKFAVLRRLLEEETDGGTLVFGRTRRGVRNLSSRLQRMGYRVGELQGDLNQQERDRVLERFRARKTPILVATNVAARGLDILHIERVINYEMPETHLLFTHRVGRTGRMGRSGRAITLLGAVDLAKWHEIERGLGRKLPRMTPEGKLIELPPQSRSPRGRNGRRGSGLQRRIGVRA